MSRLYGSVQGDERSEATRTAHRRITAHPRGWDVGVKVDGYVSDDDADTFDVEVSGGSHAGRNAVPLATIQRMRDGSVRVRFADLFGGALYDLNGVRLDYDPERSET